MTAYFNIVKKKEEKRQIKTIKNKNKIMEVYEK